MAYFEDNYASLSYPIAGGANGGFRPAQIAAVQAVCAHFFNSKQPAIVSMPTGSGKTTVLMALAFALRAKRVLILTPSRLVREQIAENFSSLADLKKLGALPLDLATPSVFTTDGNVGSDEQWESLRAYDCVVATVPAVSPRGDTIPEAPRDLFDVVLVDEAHHAPAKTWSRLLELLKEARQILLTATPFRRDEKEIRGKFVFNYDLRRAHQDRVFGDIAFQAVAIVPGRSVDVAIAKATETQFQIDRAAGLQHLVMVRADTVGRAKELHKLYSEDTTLQLAFVNGQHSLAHVKRVVAKLRDRELDGVVCVNMFGEGFNLPNLKIAAVHSPHKSLAVTLQFIGRFARAGDETIGQATFIAEPNSSGDDISELYEAGAVWREIVQNLSEARIETEIQTRDVLDSFEVSATPDLDDFSLYTVAPYFHSKIFFAPEATDLTATPNFPAKLQVIFSGISHPHNAAIYVTREAVRSAWSTDDRFTNLAYDLFIFHHHRTSGLLFICASRRNAKLYSRLALNLVGGRPRSLSHAAISRALNDLEGAQFFSVGMRKRHKLGQIESYRIISGPTADRAIQHTDGHLFARGHCFGTALENGNEVTIGVSTSSKVWSNAYDRIPQLIAWCDRIAEKIASGRNTPTGSRIDMLSVGEELARVPAGIVAMTLNHETYSELPMVFYHGPDGQLIERTLMDFDLQIIESVDGSVSFAISNKDVRWEGVFSLDSENLIEPASDDEPEIVVHVDNEDIPLSEFLNEQNPSFFCQDLSYIEGTSRFPIPTEIEPFGENDFESVDWVANAVTITLEKPAANGGKSIFEWLEAELVASDADVVFCDDGTGEVADFISITDTPDGPRVKFFHCKASGAPQPGNRVADLYEVAGQAIKSCVWARTEKLLQRIEHRSRLPSVRGYVKGIHADTARILGYQSRQQVQFEIHIVQPGVMKQGRTIELSNILAATRHYLIQGGIDLFKIFGS